MFGRSWTRKFQPDKIEVILPNRHRLVLLSDDAVWESESPPEETDWVVRAIKLAVRG